MSLETFAYGDHDLQTVTVATPLPDPASSTPRATNAHAGTGTDTDDGYWVILVHGGAWRDPTQTATSYLVPALRILSSSSASQTSNLIKGIASVSYRLSPHPAHPQDPTSTLPSSKRDARHPDHLYDLQTALSFLQNKYGFGGRYVLVGHSCGATMAVQSVMPSLSSLKVDGMGGEGAGEQVGYAKPLAILGCGGIYNMRLLRDTHKDIDAYQQFLTGAFGDNEETWDALSPGVVEGPEGVDGWDSGKVIVLAHSQDDELCDFAQSETMKGFLRGWEDKKKEEGEVHFFPIEGGHNDVWVKGEGLARGILYTIEKLQGMGP